MQAQIRRNSFFPGISDAKRAEQFFLSTTFTVSKFCAFAIVTFQFSPGCLAYGSRTDAFRTVALTNQHAPGFTDDVIFFNRSGGTGFFEPVINNNGDVAFFARLGGPSIDSSNETGIWAEKNGVLQSVAHQGNPVPSIGPDVVLQYPYTPRYSENGDLLYAFSIEGTGVFPSIGTILWFDDTLNGGARQQVARLGYPAPGTPDGVTFIDDDGMIETARLNRHGDVAFGSDTNDPNNFYFSTGGVWLWQNQELSVISYSEMPVPELPDLWFGGTSLVGLNDSGQVAISGRIDGPGVVTTNDTGLWLVTDGDYDLIIREGEPVPSVAGTTFGSLGSYGINNAGEVMFDSDLENPPFSDKSSLWSTSNGGLHPVVIEDDPAPGTATGTEIRQFQFPVMNDRGEVVFAAVINGPDTDPTNDSAIFVERGGDLELLIREGDQIPDLPPGTLLGPSHGTRLMLNDAGQIAFLTELTGPAVDFTNNTAIIATTVNGELRTLVREGDLVETTLSVDPFRPITNIELFTNTSNADGKHSSFNDRGQLAFEITVSNTHYGGILVSDLVEVPEPLSISLSSLCALVCLIVRPPKVSYLVH